MGLNFPLWMREVKSLVPMHRAILTLLVPKATTNISLVQTLNLLIPLTVICPPLLCCFQLGEDFLNDGTTWLYLQTLSAVNSLIFCILGLAGLDQTATGWKWCVLSLEQYRHEQISYLHLHIFSQACLHSSFSYNMPP